MRKLARRLKRRLIARDMSRILIAGIVILVLAFNATCISMLVQERNDARRQVGIALGNLATAVGRDIARNVEVIDSSLQAARSALLLQPASATDPQWRGRLPLADGRPRDFGAVEVANEIGDIILTSSSTLDTQGNVAARDFFRAQRDNIEAGLYISQSFRDSRDGLWYIVASRRISRADGSFAGIIFSSLRLDYFLDLFGQMDLGTGGALGVLRADGTLLARTPFVIRDVNLDMSNTPLFRGERTSARGSFCGISPADGIQRIYAYSRLNGLPLVVIAGRESDEIYATWRQRARMLVSVMVSLTLAILGLAFALRYELRRRWLARDEALRNAALFRDAANASPIGSALMAIGGGLILVNPALCRMLGYSRAELMGGQVLDLPQEGKAGQTARINELLQGRLDCFQTEQRYTRHDGTHFWAHRSISVVRDQHGRGQYLMLQLQDIDARKHAEEALEEEKERLQTTLYSIGDAVISTDDQANVRFMNPAAETMTGIVIAQAAGRSIDSVFKPVDVGNRTPIAGPVRLCLASRRTLHLQERAALIRADGEIRDIQGSASPVKTPAGDVIGAVLVFRDVSAARDLQRRLRYNATHDALTGLPNRSAFEASLEHALANAREQQANHVLAFVDLDRFKIINDSAGHAAGDALLQDIASLLPKQLRHGDTVGRLGGDEFGIILLDCGLDDARVLLERMIATIGAVRFFWNGTYYSAGASVGVTEVRADAQSQNVLLTQADVACYAAKRAGRNRLSIYNPRQSDAVDRHREIVVAAGLRKALDDKRFRLFAQKIISCDQTREPRLEVLVRLLDEHGQLIPPSIFIPAAERYDQMADIDRWVLEETLIAQGEAIASIEGLHVHLNLSANSLNSPSIEDTLLGLLSRSPVAPAAITFEITETALVRNLSNASGIIAKLRAIGCQVALDDFGIGLSSFSYLRSFPVDIVKIDGGFISKMTENVVDQHIARAIHQIASDLNAVTIAESIENRSTFEQVRALGIEFGQGFELHRPAPIAEVLAEYAAEQAVAHTPEPR